MKYKLTIAYVGQNYCGWQSQVNKNTIQDVLTQAISKALDCSVTLTASGRTDAGVSAISQVVSFEYDKQISKYFLGHVNQILPSSISCTSIVECDKDFSARFSAKKKTYKYSFYFGYARNAYLDQFCYHVKGSIDMDKVNKAISQLIGAHDFSCFCATNSSIENKTRTIYDARIENCGSFYTFYITGNGFLYNMVRIIVGTLIGIGQNKLGSMASIIDSKSRKNAGITTPSAFLVLDNVVY